MENGIERVARAAREAVVAVRAVDRTGIVVSGEDRVAWLNGLVTCDLAKLAPGQGAYGLVVEKKGRIQADLFAAPSTSPGALALAVPREVRDALVTTLDHYLVMEDAELSPADLAFWLLHGPGARRVTEGLSAPFAGTVDLFGWGGAVVAAPEADAAALAERLAALVEANGGVVVDDAAWEPVRIERGLPRFGVEVDATLYPQEASLERLAVAFDKGCYLGQEVVYMLENRGHVKRKLVALEVESDRPPGKGEAVTTSEGAAVGEVKSAAVGPESGRPVAIAMVKWAQAKPGTELRIGDRVARVREPPR